jgi:hypothetical protein
MKLTWFVLLSALVIVALGGCQPEEATIVPTPAADILLANQAAAPSLLTLARNPAAFEDQDLVLAGVYHPLPLPVCAEETHQSPATWTLRDGEIEIPVSGFDSQLRELAAPGLSLEVEGHWQRWEGPVGCGRRAPSQLVWYLQLTNILSPNPLSASLPLTPGSAVPEATTPSPDAVAGGVATAPSLAATTTATRPLGEGALTAAPGSSGTPTPIGSATSAAGALPTGSVTATLTVTTIASGTPAGTATPTPGTNTPTATTVSSVPTPTPTIDTGRARLLDYDDLGKRTITASGVQEWQFAGATDLPIVINVAPSSGLDVILELIDPTDELLGTFDQMGAGQSETIVQNQLPRTGLYTLRVFTADQSSGSYAIVLQSESSRPTVTFQGILTYGEIRSGTTPADGDHLWNFEGAAGDIVNIRVRATTPTDMQIYLNSFDGEETEFKNDNTVYFPPDDREELLGYQLPATGLYTVGIGEENLESLGYTIVIERAS